MEEFLLIFIFVLIALGFVFAALLLGKLMRPQVFDPEKTTTYECGERPFSKAWFNYNPRFYRYAIMFIVFDVALAATIPSFVIFSHFVKEQTYLPLLISLIVFLILLMVPLIYVWIKGDLNWKKK